MSKGLVIGLGAALAACALSAADASACSRRARDCGFYAPPAAYRVAPPPAYGYLPPAPPYGYGPPPAAYYAPPPPAPGYYGAGYGYGPRAGRGCGDAYGYAPPAAYDGYRPAGVWLPVR